MADYYLVRGEAPPTVASFAVQSKGVSQTIGGITTVTFSMWPLATPSSNPVINAAAGGSSVGGDGFTRLTYQFTATDTATAGDFLARFTVNYAGGKDNIWPDPSYLNIHIS